MSGRHARAQVWELDRALLHKAALPGVEGYTWERGTLLRALDMDEFLPPPPHSALAHLGAPRIARRIQRSGRCLLRLRGCACG